MTNQHAWLSRCAVALTLAGCGGTDGPPAMVDTGPGADGSSCPGLDDGIDCTADTCVAAAAQHTPDDGACGSFTAGPVCDPAGPIVQDVGVCDSVAGCMTETQIVEDCAAPPAPTASCTGSTSTADLAFRPAMGICQDGGTGPVCGQPSISCTASTPPSCAGGSLTSATATCDGSPVAERPRRRWTARHALLGARAQPTSPTTRRARTGPRVCPWAAK